MCLESIRDIKHSSDFLKNIINIFVYDLFKMFVWHTECCHSLKWMLTNQTSSKAHQHLTATVLIDTFWIVAESSRGQNMRAESQTELFKMDSWPDWCTASAGPEASPTVSVCLGSFSLKLYLDWFNLCCEGWLDTHTHTHSLFSYICGDILLTECFL